MEEIFFLVEDDPEGGYVARGVGFSVFTQGETLQDLKKNIKDAVACHFGNGVPGIIHLHIVHDEVLAYA